MSTLSHTAQQTLRHPSSRQVTVAALIALVAAAAVTIVLIASSGTSGSISIGGPQTGVQHGTPAQELEAVSGARFGLRAAAPAAAVSPTSSTPSSNGDATNAGPRYRLPGQLGQGSRLGAKLR